jgi:aryl-alcohol dehydrogenase-like predicted oxidoreductase
MAPPQRKTPLSAVLPPVIFGTGTFNYQFVANPYEMDANGLVQYALEHGIRAFDTSPYYGPSEMILGGALNTDSVRMNFPRESYYLITKCGRISMDEFDYSPQWIRKSVRRSLERLHTSYLDLVYCHDVEFVSEEEAVEAVKELRRIRDEEGTIKYVGISGYPVPVLCQVAKRVLQQTGEPLDAVLSYANFNLQNTLLASHGIQELKEAGVEVVPNASPLGMGLLRREGVPTGGAGDWHPASSGLRAAVKCASEFCDDHDERIGVVALRWALESWAEVGASLGSRGDPASGVPRSRDSNEEAGGKLGVTVVGFTRKEELEKGLQVWRSILDGLEGGDETARKAGRWYRDHEWSLNRGKAVQILADGIREILAEHVDFTWDSPPQGFVNKCLVDKQDDGSLMTPATTP